MTKDRGRVSEERRLASSQEHEAEAIVLREQSPDGLNFQREELRPFRAAASAPHVLDAVAAVW